MLMPRMFPFDQLVAGLSLRAGHRLVKRKPVRCSRREQIGSVGSNQGAMPARSLHIFLGERRRILFGFFVTGLLVAFGWHVLRPHEPGYQGRPLSIWLQRAYPRGAYDLSPPSTEAATAVSAIGADAVPQLLKMVAAGDSIERRILASFAREFPFLHVPVQENEGEVAVWGFEVLGPKAKSAVPALARLLNSRDALVRINAARSLSGLGPAAQEAVPVLITVLCQTGGTRWQDTALRDAAAGALGEIGPAAVPAIPQLAALTNVLAAELALRKIRGDSFLPFIERLNDISDPRRWAQAAALLAGLGTNAEAAVPLLLSGLSSTNYTMREQALHALTRIKRRPDLCIPALTALLEFPDPNVRYQSLLGLAAFGAEAKPAIPKIIRVIERSPQWQWVQWEATNALRAIDPDTAAKVVIRPAP
jgi:HEAT repeat protein